MSSPESQRQPESSEPTTAQRPRTVVVRPRKIRRVAWISAVVLVVLFSVVAVLLRTTPTGVYFHASDQVSMVVLGLLLGAGALLFARPRLRMDAEGVEVRNVLTNKKYPWSEIEAVSFPDGAAWARLELPDDEYVTILAIQATDGSYAVKAMRALRAAYRKASSA